MNDILIPLPKNDVIRRALEAKLQEYRRRLRAPGSAWQFSHPQLAYKLNPGFRDASHKVAVLEKVLAAKEPVSANSLYVQMMQSHQKDFDARSFQTALGVITQYCDGSLKL